MESFPNSRPTTQVKMRTYSKDYVNHPRSAPYVTAKQRAERLAREWDIRIDVNLFITPNDIKTCLLTDLEGLDYALISGIEVPDTKFGNYDPSKVGASGSTQEHVHIALIFKEPVNRERALRACRPAKLTDEYAVPRNPKFTYAGWLAHHTKEAFKLDPLMPAIFFEHGFLPEDAMDEATCWKVAKILKKFGSKSIKARFGAYYEALDAFKAAKRNEEIQAKPNAPVSEGFVMPPIPKIPDHMVVKVKRD